MSEGVSRADETPKGIDTPTLDGEDPGWPARARGIQPGGRLGRYMVLEVLGRGGMGVVYAAFDPQLDRRVALKVLRPDRDASRKPRHTQRLLREAQAMARLAHPNVIAVHDVGTIEDEVVLAMEYVDGPTLTQWVAEHERSWVEIRDTYVQAGRGLAAAHAAGLVHRDFKPDNVLVDAHGRARVTDFGLVRVDDASSSDVVSPGKVGETVGDGTPLSLRLTQVGARIGTPGYMAPEQHKGEPADALSDQFSFCVALYEAFFGRPPFAGLTLPELTANVLGGKIRPPPRDSPVPGRVRRAVLRGLSRKPEHRFASMNALLDELAYDPGRRRRLALLGVGAMTLAGLAAFAGARSADSAGGTDCSREGNDLRDAFDDERRASLAAAFSAAGTTVGPYVWTRVESRLDAYVERFALVAEEVCTARATAARDHETLTRQDRCLASVVAGFDAQLDVFAQADGELVDRAGDAVGRLRRPEDCADLERLEQQQPLPDDPDVRAAIEGAEVRLAEVTALDNAARFPEAVVAASSLLREVEPLGWEPLTIDVLDELGTAQGHELDTKAALDTLGRAAALAGALGDDTRLASVWLNYLSHLAQMPGRQRETLAKAEVVATLLEPADARAPRLASIRGTAQLMMGDYVTARDTLSAVLALEGVDPSIRATTLNNYAVTLLQLGQYGEARRVFEEQIAAARERYGEADHVQIVDYLTNIAITLRYQGDVDRTLQVVDEAEAMRKRLGRRLTIQSTLYMVRADVALARHDLDEAEAAIQRAADWVSERDDPISLLSTKLAQAELLALRGDFGQARSVLAAVREGLMRLQGEASVGVGLADAQLANLERLAGNRDAALAQFERAIPELEAALHDRHPMLAQPLASFGHLLLETGQPERAEHVLRRAIAIGERADLAAPVLARPRFDLARIVGGDEADTLVALASADAARALPHDPGLPAEIEAWLAENPERAQQASQLK